MTLDKYLLDRADAYDELATYAFNENDYERGNLFKGRAEGLRQAAELVSENDYNNHEPLT